MVNQEELQQKYAQFQLMQQQIEEINKHLEMLQEQNGELDISINAVLELSKTKVENEFLAPLANGIFVKGKISDNQKLVVNVGSNVTVEKTPLEVASLLEQQKKELANQLVETQAVFAEINEEMMKLYNELKEHSEE